LCIVGPVHRGGADILRYSILSMRGHAMKIRSEVVGWLLAIGALFRPHFRAAFAFGVAINLLLLVSPLYMLQVYDRVLSSGSFDPLLWLTLIAVFLLGVYAAAEAGRRRISLLLASALEDHFAPKIFVRFESGQDGEPQLSADLQRLSRVTAVFQSGGVLALFDLPFAPLFLILLFILHPVLGLVGLAGSAMVFVMTARAEVAARAVSRSASSGQATALDFANGLIRQRSAMIAMGIVARAYGRWATLRERASALAMMAGDKEGRQAGVSRSLRQILQVLVLAVGAGLALGQWVSPGAIVASSILVARALAPIDQITGGWRQLVQAREAWLELAERFGDAVAAPSFTPLPRPDAVLTIDRLAVTVPGRDQPIIRPFSYRIAKGCRVAMIGPNGAGKSALLQTLAGVWLPGAGGVALGNRNLHAWPSRDRGPFIGYVPQDIELLPATVAENIARLEVRDTGDVIDAAQRCGAHDAILSLPKGYDTMVGPGGMALSRGQTQLVGLARAFYGDPVLLLLDEPTANLDPRTADATNAAIKAFSDGGGIVVTVTHDMRLVGDVDEILVIDGGSISVTTPKDYFADRAPKIHVVSKSVEA